MLDPPPLRDWWTAVGSVTDPDAQDAEVGTSVLARAMTRLLSLLPG